MRTRKQVAECVQKHGRYFAGYEKPYKISVADKAYESDCTNDLVEQIWKDLKPQITCAGCGKWKWTDGLHRYEDDYYCNDCLPMRDEILAMARKLALFAATLDSELQGKDRDLVGALVSDLYDLEERVRVLVRDQKEDAGNYDRSEYDEDEHQPTRTAQVLGEPITD
jgi:hypothetical protein